MLILPSAVGFARGRARQGRGAPAAGSETETPFAAYAAVSRRLGARTPFDLLSTPLLPSPFIPAVYCPVRCVGVRHRVSLHLVVTRGLPVRIPSAARVPVVRAILESGYHRRGSSVRDERREGGRLPARQRCRPLFLAASQAIFVAVAAPQSSHRTAAVLLPS